MSNLAARLLTAAVLIPLLVAAIRWENPVGVWAIVFVATGLGLREFFNMTMRGTSVVERGLATVLGLGFAAAIYWHGGDGMLVAAWLAGVVIAQFIYVLFRFGTMETVASRVTAALAGVLYVGLLLTYVALLKKRGSDGGAWVYIVLTVTWFSDTGAYFAGRFIGPYWPKKMYEAVSPKKTLIGLFGGILASVGALVLAKLWYFTPLSWADVFLIALPANLLGQVGDLCESMLKRSVGVKDSGALLPGHGGMLDRIDALLFTAPYVFCYARWVFGKL
jgi:phosphatidate cytidylyltransferase